MSYLKIPHSDVQEILALYEPREEMLALAQPNQPPQALIELAIENALFADAVTFLAHGLPVREAIWWACCCAGARYDWNDKEQDAIRAAKAWVHSPDETSRRHAENMAALATLQNGAGWAAQAAFWSGGSMTAPTDPVVPPPEYLYAQAVAGAVNLTAVLPDGEQAEQRYKEFLDMGINIAHGGNGNIGSAA